MEPFIDFTQATRRSYIAVVISEGHEDIGSIGGIAQDFIFKILCGGICFFFDYL